jgi:hypothetical protein
MKKLLVGSVYGSTPRNPQWLALQQHFLRKTVESFDLAVYLNCDTPEMFRACKIIHAPSSSASSRPLAPSPDAPLGCQKPARLFKRLVKGAGSQVPLLKTTIKTTVNYARKLMGPRTVESEHTRGLNAVLDYFRQHPGYENYLILDSDAFPFQDGWLEKLLGWMKGGAGMQEKYFAAAVRTENLDTFPHPCVFFVRGSFLAKASFDFRGRAHAPHINLLGDPLADVGSAISPMHEGRHVMLPLLRTNAWNPHPVLGAIYGGMFYHHGAGSRELSIRIINAGYFDHFIPRAAHSAVEAELYAELCADPDRLMRKLLGPWLPAEPAMSKAG